MPEGSDPKLLESRISVRFRDRSLLNNALTHRSFSFESGAGPHNERLEFLGDAVLGLAVTDMIFAWYPELPEGEMAKLRASTVNMAVLADSARNIELGTYLLLGRGEELSGGRDKSSILADAFEALLGAVYLDGGMDVGRSLIERSLADHIRDHVERGVVRDFKTNLQEIAAQGGGSLPEYRITSSGPDHAKRFEAHVSVRGELLGTGSGRSKKEAEQSAAKQALTNLEDREKVSDA